MAELSELRDQISQIDDELLELICRRQEVVQEVARYKIEHELPVLDAGRERSHLFELLAKTPDELKNPMQLVLQLLMEISRNSQAKLIQTDKKAQDLILAIEAARAESPELFPVEAKVALQGLEGSYQQIACDKLFRRANICFFKNFHKVFEAVENNEVDFGLVPIENSTAGSVNQVYDLMHKHRFYIVKTIRLKINHNLLVKPGTKLENLRHIYSHEQAINQCSSFLKELDNIEVHAVENTAVAADLVSKSQAFDSAALASESSAAIFGLEILKRAVQNNAANYTRFVCIAKKMQIYPGANRHSFIIVTKNGPGSLYKVLAKFYGLGINLVKLESRPIAETDFEHRFYFDIDCPIAAPEFKELLASMSEVCQDWRYLGSYSEVLS